MTEKLPDISLIDFSDPADIGGYVALMGQTAGNMGALLPGFRPNREWDALRRTAKSIVGRLQTSLPQMAPSALITAVEAYDLAHRIAYSSPGDSRLINRCILDAFSSRIRGDKGIDEYALFKVISRKIHQRDPLYFDKPLQWMCIYESRWVKRINEEKPEYDRLNQASILLVSDLSTYTGRNQEPYKRRLFEQHRHYLDSHSSDYRILQSVDSLLLSSLRYLSSEEIAAYRSRISSELLANPDTNRFYRLTLRLQSPLFSA